MSGNQPSLVDRWQNRFEGQLLALDHPDYNTARHIWNGMIERNPALIARCKSPADVAKAIQIARAEGLRISVRGGGHGVAGNAVCEGGLMIDLSLMKGINVDPNSRELVAAPGVLWGELDRAAEAHQLATTGGQISHTGIAGLTLGGGFGYLMSKHGAVCDNLLSVDMVTADGEFITASESSNPDLFWALRGAGANFGVATSFRYRLHPLSGVLAGLLLYPRDRAEELAAFYSEFLRSTPDELNSTLAFLYSPDGAPLVAVVAVYAGAPEEGERVLEPLRSFGSPVVDMIRPMAYTEAQSLLDAAAPIGNRYYWKSNFVDTLDPDLIKMLHHGANAMPSPRSMILLFSLNGQIRRIPKEAMAFDHRDANFELSIIAEWIDPAQDAENISWARNLWTVVQPFVLPAVYANHMTADESPDRIRAAYGASKFARLAELKKKYDPENIFRLNHNIPPQTNSVV